MLYDGGRSINSLNRLKNLAHIAKELGLLVFSLPFLHLGYYSKQDITYREKENPNYQLPEHVSNTLSGVPADAQITRVLRDGELECEFPVRNERKDWVFDVHTDDEPPNDLHGEWPIKGARLPNSANLTKEGAVEMARKYFTGK